MVNCKTERYIDHGFHGDVFHWYPTTQNTENIIAYNLEAYDFTSQGIFSEVFRGNDQMHNVAFVNVHISKDTVNYNGSWWEMETNHLLLWHVSMPDQIFRWNQQNENTTVRNVSIVGSVFYAFTHTQLPSGTEIEHIHYTNPDVYQSWEAGNDLTTGNAGFANTGSRNYRPSATSALVDRVTNPRIPADCSGTRRGSRTAIGAWTGPDE